MSNERRAGHHKSVCSKLAQWAPGKVRITHALVTALSRCQQLKELDLSAAKLHGPAAVRVSTGSPDVGWGRQSCKPWEGAGVVGGLSRHVTDPGPPLRQ